MAQCQIQTTAKQALLTALWGSTLREAVLRANTQLPAPEQHSPTPHPDSGLLQNRHDIVPTTNASTKTPDPTAEPADLLHPPIAVF